MLLRSLCTPIIFCGVIVAAEPATAPETPKPPVPPTPAAPPPTPPVITVNQNRIDWNQVRADFQSSDAAKQQAATKMLIEAGANGYNVLGSLLNEKDAAIVKRANEARDQIDTKSFQMYQETAELAGKVQKEPLTTAALETVRQAWMKLAMYAAQAAMKQTSFQNAQELQKMIKNIDDSTKQLAALDVQLKNAPEPQGLARASLQLDRSGLLMTLQRPKEALSAAQDAAISSGKEGRLTPGALKAQADATIRLDDRKATSAICRQILQAYPRSLEVKFAYSSLIQVAIADKSWDEAVELSKTFLGLCPLDDSAQDSVYGVLDAMMSTERDYKHVTPYAEWILATLPLERLTAEVPKMIGGGNEYVLRNYAKAERAYTMLRDKFTDMVSTPDMDGALARIKAKGEGKFPKEPLDTDPGLAGVFAKFLKAVREKDTKTLATLVPKADSEEFIENFNNGDDILPIMTFGDFIVKKGDIDDKKTSSEIVIDYYAASSSKPKEMTLQTVKEDGQWKIVWEAPEGDDNGVQLQPAPAPTAPGPVAAPAEPKK